MAAKLVTIANMKGGVGKTTTTVTLAETLTANNGLRVLVVDFDPQTNCTHMLIGGTNWLTLRDDRDTVSDFFLDARDDEPSADLTRYVQSYCTDLRNRRSETVPELSLIAGTPDLHFTERQFIADYYEGNADFAPVRNAIAYILQTGLAPLREHFDFILFDCAPSISFFGEAAIWLSDMIVIPSVPDSLSAYGYDRLRKHIAEIPQLPNSHVEKLFVLVTKYDSRVPAHAAQLRRLRNELGYQCFDTVIPQFTAIARAAFWSDEPRTFGEKYGLRASRVIRQAGDEFLRKVVDVI